MFLRSISFAFFCAMLAGLAGFGAVLAAPATAHAEDAQYEEIVHNALSEFDAGHYEEAAALFEQAHAKSPSARTHRGLGMAYYEGRRYVLAVQHLRASLTDQRRPLTTEQRATAEQTLKQAEAFVAHFHVELLPNNATLEVDGQLTEIHDNELLLDVGRHELIARAPGRAEDRRIVEARAAAPMQLTIDLSAAPADVAPSAAPATAPGDSQSGGRRGPGIAPWVVMGAGGALLIGSGVTWMLANDAQSTLEKKCPGGQCPGNSVPSEKASGQTLVTVTDVLLIGGGVTLAAGLTWWALSRSHASDTQPTAAALCTPSGCSAQLRGKF